MSIADSNITLCRATWRSVSDGRDVCETKRRRRTDARGLARRRRSARADPRLHGDPGRGTRRPVRLLARPLAREHDRHAGVVRLLSDADGARRLDGARLYHVLHYRSHDVRNVPGDPAPALGTPRM